jgi:hypothetical protein
MMKERHVGAEIDRLRARGQDFPVHSRTQRLDRRPSAEQERVDVVPLRHALARQSVIGRDVALHDDHFGGMPRNGDGGEEAGDAAADHHGAAAAR